MTLIITQISKYGIILASDSNLTSNEADVGEGKKVFPISFLKAGLCLAGAYSVQGQSMDDWMDQFITAQEVVPNLTLKQFAHNLKAALETQMSNNELAGGSLIQIAGYVEEEESFHPEFWFVRNIYEIDPRTGEYTDVRPDFLVTEDFWARDCPKVNLERGEYRAYVNGFAPGRITYVVLERTLNDFFQTVWSQPWKLRPPNSLGEAEHFVRLYIQFITTLFLSSDYSAHYIGGQTQVETIVSPTNTTLDCSNTYSV